MSENKIPSGGRASRLYVTQTSALRDKDGKQVPRDRVVMVPGKKIEQLLKAGSIRQANNRDMAAAKDAFRDAVALAE
jgi:hypothetical protein